MNSTTDAEEFDAFENDFIYSFLAYLLFVIKTIVAIWICCNNSVILYIVAKHQHLRSYSNALVANLLLTDNVVAVYCIIFVLYYVTSPHSQQEQRFLCLALNFFGLTGLCLSGTSLASADIERYLKICHPFLYERIMSWRTVVTLIIVPYGVTFILVILFLSDNHFHYKVQCGLAYNMKYEHLVLLNIVSALLITFVIILTCRMLIVIRRHENAIQHQHQGNGDHTKEHNRSKTIGKMTLFIFVSYWPFGIVALILAIHKDIQSSFFAKLAYSFVVGFCLLNNVMNSVVFGWRDREVRNILRRMFLRRKIIRVVHVDNQSVNLHI